MNKKTVMIEGMHCESCARIVKEEFSKIEGVKNTAVDLTKKEAIIEYTLPELDLRTLNDMIKPFGFTIKDL